VFASVVGLCVFSFMVFLRKYFEKISIIILKRKSSILVQLVDYEKLIDQESEYNFPKWKEDKVLGGSDKLCNCDLPLFLLE
jgi:hypothetical protein